MNPEMNQLPVTIGLQRELFFNLPATILLANVKDRAEFGLPAQLALNSWNNWPFTHPDPLLLKRDQIPFFTTYRQAIQLLLIDPEKRRLIRAIQLPPVPRFFYLFKILIFNGLERIFPPNSSTGSAIKNIRQRYE